MWRICRMQKGWLSCRATVANRHRAYQNRLMKLNWEKLCAVATEEVEATLAALPKPLRERAKELPVTLERIPNAGLQEDGIEPDTLGLFTGAEFAEEGHVPLPPQIILFLENLWDLAEGEEKVFASRCGRRFCMSWAIIWVWTRMN